MRYIVTLIVLIFLILLPIGLTVIAYTNNQNIQITVKDKYIKNAKSDGKYLIVDTENNTYEITDLFFKGKFNSTDIYNQLEEGNTYEIEISGYRIPIFSMYPNINKIIK